MTNYVKAKMSFYHDAVGSRAQNEAFQVNDAQTLKALEDAGLVQKIEANAQEIQSQQKRADLMGKAQALTNEAVSMTHHEQNAQANQHVQQMKKEAQQRAEQKGANYSNEADKQAKEQNAKMPNPSAVTPKATAKKANEK